MRAPEDEVQAPADRQPKRCAANDVERIVRADVDPRQQDERDRERFDAAAVVPDTISRARTS
jgi:hypothetical protein